MTIAEESQHIPLEEAFGDEVSGDAVPAPAPLPQRAPAPVVEPDTDHMSAVEELVEALSRPFTVSAVLSLFFRLILWFFKEKAYEMIRYDMQRLERQRRLIWHELILPAVEILVAGIFGLALEELLLLVMYWESVCF